MVNPALWRFALLANIFGFLFNGFNLLAGISTRPTISFICMLIGAACILWLLYVTTPEKADG